MAGGDDDAESAAVTSGLIAALAAEGAHVADRDFSIDPRKARDKLRAYQLDDPHSYVLLLVEAARIVGDDSINFSCGPQTQASFEGLSLSASELENVFNAVFSSTQGLSGRDRCAARLAQLLGIAANAALALAPESLEIENTDAAGQLHRLTIIPDGAIRCEALGGGPPARTRFVFNGGREDQRDDAEVELLRTRCRFTEMNISIYGRRVSQGSRAALLGAKTRRIKLHGETIGRAGLTQADAKLLLLTRGVLSETIPLPRAVPGFVAVVDSDLRKDLSQANVIRDAAFDEVIASVEEVHASLTTQRRSLLK